MKFTKIHSLGNDFLVIDQKEAAAIPDLSSFAQDICERHTGVGADGLLVIAVKDKPKGQVSFRIFNADGTEAEVSGNGLRCAAARLYQQKRIETSKILFLTTAGRRECRLIKQENNHFLIKIEMGIPKLSSPDIPFDDGAVHEKIIDYPLSINKKICLHNKKIELN